MSLLEALISNTVLLAMLLGLQVMLRTFAHGLPYALSSLDESKTKSVLEQRLDRIKNNQLEFLAILVPVYAGFAMNQTEVSNEALVGSALIFSRIGYVLVAAYGIPILRSAVWLSGFLVWVYLLFALFPTLGA